MSDQHVGVRRRPPRVPVARVVPLVVGLAAVVWALTLAEPGHPAGQAQAPISVAPTWTPPPTVAIPGVLEDGATYTPRLYLTADTTVGVAMGADGSVRVILAHAAGSFTQLRARPAEDNAQVNGFAADGDTVVWMESVARAGATPVTTLWRATWSADAPPVQVTTYTGEVSFAGFATDVVLTGGVVRWTAIAPGQTEVRSVPVSGGFVNIDPVDGEYRLAAPPWAVTVPAGAGSTVTLLNLETRASVSVAGGPADAAVCDPDWCRVSITGGAGLVGIDMMRPDGSDRRRIAGPEATPTIADPTLLGRFVPLATDSSDGVGLSLYDLATGRMQLVAEQATNVSGRGSTLWWSTGLGADLMWHALDLAHLP